MTTYLDSFDAWINGLGIMRNYSANLKSLNKHVLSKLTDSEDFLLELYQQAVAHGFSDHLSHECNLLEAALKLEKKTGLTDIKLAKGTFNDCMSAFRKFCWFLKTIQIASEPAISLKPIVQPNIIWINDPRKEMNTDLRLKTQNRLNMDEEKMANFPSRLIDQIANNAGKWADNAKLSHEHPARKLKEAQGKWLDNLVNKIIFLIEDGKQVRFEDIDKIGTLKISDVCYHVYIKIKGSDAIHQVYTRKKDGSKDIMVLPSNEISNITIDHVYRMEDLLKDLQDAFPVLKELTALFRNNIVGNIRSTETLHMVRGHIENNFANTYADKMAQLIKELDILEKVISLEAITKKDNLDKH